MQPNYLLANDNELEKQSNLLSECRLQYKKCTTEILDSVDKFFKNYEADEKLCLEKIGTIQNVEYQYIDCQDQLIKCKGEGDLISTRINSGDNIELVEGNPVKNGVSQLTLNVIKQEVSSIPKLKSLLIARNNKLIFEEYYSQKDSQYPHHVWSVTKSVMALLTGIAIDKNYITSEDTNINSYFPEYFEGDHDQRKDDISIKDVLTMTTGINFTDNNNWYDWGSYEPYPRDDNARDWILNYGMLLNYQPGEVWLYGSPNTDLLSSIINSSTGMTTLEFAEKYLFEPLNIKNYFWVHDSEENYYGGFMLYLRPRALMQIGQMVLNNGAYDGKQIVSSEWINRALASHSELGGEEGFAYGYLWWRFRVGNYQVISAFGYGGQLITLVPELDLIITTTSDSSSSCTKASVDDQFDAVLDLVRTVILTIKK